MKNILDIRDGNDIIRSDMKIIFIYRNRIAVRARFSGREIRREQKRRRMNEMRTILHSDANCFYASVEMLHHPEYAGKPLAVGGNPETRHGIILTANYIAKHRGVKTGSALWEAREACPDLIIIPPRYDSYLRFSGYLRAIYSEYTDRVEPFGLDECWLDVTASCPIRGDGREIADEINRRVKKELGITVSVGVSWNKIFAKYGSDYRKPDAVTEVTRDNYREIVWEKPVSDLLYVGRATERKLRKFGICTIGDLAGTDPSFLQRQFGKMGLTLSIFANGEDQTPVCLENTQPPVRSIGNGMTMPYDLTTDEEVRVAVYMLSETVARRLRENDFAGHVVGISVRDSDLHGFTRQHRIEVPTDISREIAEEAYRLFLENYSWEKPIRGIGVRVSDLVSSHSPYQLSFFRDERMRRKQYVMDQTVESIRRRFGDDAVCRGLMAFGPPVTPRKRQEQTIHPLSYFRNGNQSGAGACASGSFRCI